MSGRIAVPKSLDKRLRGWLTSHPDGHERGAFVLFRKFDRPVDVLPTSPRFIAVDVIEIPNEWTIESSATRFRFNMRMLPPIYFRCEQQGLMLGFAHNHPSNDHDFSPKDDRNEQNILRGYSGSNGPDVSLLALLLVSDRWRARIRFAKSPDQSESIRHILVLSDYVEMHSEDLAPVTDIQMRQEAAFGKPFNRNLKSLRATVVGAGGTGSSLATLLARAGAGELIIIDGDNVEDSNLNRTRGYRKKDVGRNKAQRLSKFINKLELGCKVTYIPKYLGESPSAIDAISGSDIVFGCTDDVEGRDILNQAMYYYCLPYIDVGLTGAIDTDSDNIPYLRDHRGRVSTILPESGACLRCQGVVTQNKLAYERAIIERPELAKLDPDTLRREYYLTGGGESAPGIGPFTNAVADLAVASFFNLLRPFRRLSSDFRTDNIWYDFVHLQLYSNLPELDPNCFCCGPDGLLNAPEGSYRLSMPRLGRLQN
jgi:hypothetical protein